MKTIYTYRISHILYALLIPLLLPLSILAQSRPPETTAPPVSEEWARRFDNKARAGTQAKVAAIDAEGNVYITGNSYSTAGYESVTVKYSPLGEELWAVRQNPGNNHEVQAIAVDNSGGVYITGRESGIYGMVIVTIRYDASTGTESWKSYYKGEDDWAYNESRAIAADGAGGVYVTGLSTGAMSGNDFITIRYDAGTGAENWVSRYTGKGEEWSWEEARAIALDGAGGVYVTGLAYGDYAGLEIATVRYDAATGAESWVTHYTSHEEGWNEVRAIAADQTGGIFVTGVVIDPNTGMADYLTLGYEAATGAISWASQYNGSGDSWDEARAITTDGTGGVYVTGASIGLTTGFDYATIRYDAASGAESWVSRYDGGGPDWTFESGQSIATDGQGSVFVTGRAEGPSSGPDFGTIRYDAASGAEIWSERYNGGGENWTWDEAFVVLLDEAGGVYAVGTGHGPMDSYQGSDITIVRYEAATGQQSWVSRFEGIIVSTDDYPISLVVDAEGNSYVTGTSYAFTGQTLTTVMVTVKYSSSGEEVWINQFSEGMNNSSSGIALDQTGGVYVTGSSQGTNGGEYITIRYDAASGTQSWVSRYRGEPEEWSWSEATAITTDEAGGVYVSGTTYGSSGYYYATIRYDAGSGDESWVSRHTDEEEPNYNDKRVRDIAADGTGGIYITGNEWTVNGPVAVTFRYEASSGAQNWANTYPSSGGVALALDKQGGLFVSGVSFNEIGTEFLTIRYEAASGAESWSDHYTNGEESWYGNGATAIATDEAGGVFVTGSIFKESSFAYATIRYEAVSGEKSWISFYSGEEAGSWNIPSAIVTDGEGGVYVTGIGSTYNATFVTLKYRAESGAQEWIIKSEGPADAAVDLALDPQGNVYVTGYSRGVGSGIDFLTIKYSQHECATLPLPDISRDRTVAVGSSSRYTLSGSGADSFRWSISGEQAVSFSGQGTSAIAVDWPANPGVYKISLDYGNDCSSQTATMYVFVSDPTAGFVTGGGWIHSPYSPEYELMQQEGKANFSLVAKYQKEGQAVKGNLQLQAPSFRFVADAIDNQTLVIAGTKAYFTGHGTLNRLDGGGGETQDSQPVGYLLSVTDGNADKKSGTDNFRLIIWTINSDSSPGHILYDNQFSCSPASLDHHLQACNPIGKGSIVIHKGKPNARTSQEDELAMAEGFTVYPVPFADQLNLQHEKIRGDAPLTVVLVGIDGKTLDVSTRIAAQSEGHLQLNLQSLQLSNGVYILRLQASDDAPLYKRVLYQQ